MFDREEMVRLTREGMENSMRFFMTMNENLIKVNDVQKETINEAAKKSLELVNKSLDEYQKNTRIILSRMETMWKQVLDQNTKEKTAE
jgi:predicted metalloprotease